MTKGKCKGEDVTKISPPKVSRNGRERIPSQAKIDGEVVHIERKIAAKVEALAAKHDIDKETATQMAALAAKYDIDPEYLAFWDPEPDLRLKVELVPRPLWNRNLREMFPAKFAARRKELVGIGGVPICQICVVAQTSFTALHAHEEWQYIEKKNSGVARLRSINLICEDCHSIHHIGRTQRILGRGDAGRAEMRRLIKHFLAVNKCDMAVWEHHSRQAKTDWERRSKIANWTVDLGSFQ